MQDKHMGKKVSGYFEKTSVCHTTIAIEQSNYSYNVASGISSSPLNILRVSRMFFIYLEVCDIYSVM